MRHHMVVTSDTDRSTSLRGRILILVAIIALAVNLRPGVTSLGVVLGRIRDDLDMSATGGGIITSLPLFLFAAAGIVSPTIVRRLGLHRTTVALLLVISIGLTLRVFVHSSWVFGFTSSIALAGVAVGNVIIPGLARAHFPDRLPAVSSIYGVALVAGAMVPAFVTVPLSDWGGSWRFGLGMWALLSLVSVLPWLPLLREEVTASVDSTGPIQWSTLARSRLAWMLTAVFTAQSATAYVQLGWMPEMLVDGGRSEAYSGAMIGIVGLVGLPVTFLMPVFVRWTRDSALLPWIFGLTTSAGCLGILYSPGHLTILWAALLGIGGGVFIWMLMMIAYRTRTHEGAVALSGFAQSVGYITAALVPIAFGIARDITGDWDAPMLTLVALNLTLGITGTIALRSAPLEDTIR